MQLGRSFAATTLIFAALVASAARAQNIAIPVSNPLLGDAGAALSSGVTTEINPANAGFVDRTQLEMVGPFYKSSSLMVRYPGFASLTKAESGLSLPLGVPSFILKITPRIGIGGFYVPSLSKSIPFEAKRLPLLVFGSMNFIDLAGEAQSRGIAHLVAGIRIVRQFGVGINLTTIDAAFKAGVKASDTGLNLVSVDGTLSSTSANLGMRLDVIPGRLVVGGSFAVYSKTSLKINVASPLADAAGLDIPPMAVDNASAGDPLGNFTAGVMVSPTARIRATADVKFDRARPEKSISFVDFKQKDKDVHDTLSLRAGAIIGVNDSTNGLIGYHKEPARVGAGGRGDGSKIGFGTMEVIMMMAGLGELVPYEQYSAGAQFGLMPKTERRGKEVTGYYALTVATGLILKKASLGIDEKGETPGAYYSKSTTIPIGITYRF